MNKTNRTPSKWLPDDVKTVKIDPGAFCPPGTRLVGTSRATLASASTGRPIRRTSSLGLQRPTKEDDTFVHVFLCTEPRRQNGEDASCSSFGEPLWCLAWPLAFAGNFYVLQRKSDPRERCTTELDLKEMRTFDLGEFTLQQRQSLQQIAEGTETIRFVGNGRGNGVRKEGILSRRTWVYVVLAQAETLGVIAEDVMSEAITWARSPSKN